MQLLLIRHGIAEDLTLHSGQSDVERALTSEGRTKMQKAAKGLAQQIESIDYLIASPYLRAQQTADIIATVFPRSTRETLTLLIPGGSFHGILDYLQQYQHNDIVTLVGHETDLGELGTWLLSGHRSNWLPLKKGSAYLFEFNHHIASGEATLRWAMTSKQLAKLAVK
jgi:phosphohistidine phosphatase